MSRLLHLILTISLVLGLLPVSVAAAAETPPFVVEHSRQHLVIDAQGRYTSTVERITRLTTDYGVQHYAKHIFTYKATQQRVKVVAGFSQLPNAGKRVPLTQDWVHHGGIDADGDQEISDRHRMQINFPLAAVGSRLYSKYVLRQFTSSRPGQFGVKFALSPEIAYETSEIIVTVPRRFRLHVRTRGFEGGIVEQNAQRLTYRFVAHQPQALPAEDGSVDYTDYAPIVVLSQRPAPETIGLQYARNAAEKSEVTPLIGSLATSVVGDAANARDKARLLYEWVARNIRYLSTTVGDRGQVPRPAHQVLQQRYGDCKDYVVLLEALLRAVGIDSVAALVNLGAAFDAPTGATTIHPFNHVITYIPELDLYADATARFVPFGQLHDEILDKPTVLTRWGRIGRTPPMHADDHTTRTTIAMTMQPDGRIEGSSESLMTGVPEINSRLARFSSQDEPMAVNVKALLLRFNEIGTGEITSTPPLDIARPYAINARFKLAPTTYVDSASSLTMPVGLAPGTITQLTISTPLPSRRVPYVCDSRQDDETYRLTLPPNLRATALPRDVAFDDGEIRYVSTYRLEGTDVIVSRQLRTQYPRRQCSPEQHTKLVAALETIRKDVRAPIFFEPVDSR